MPAVRQALILAFVLLLVGCSSEPASSPARNGPESDSAVKWRIAGARTTIYDAIDNPVSLEATEVVWERMPFPVFELNLLQQVSVRDLEIHIPAGTQTWTLPARAKDRARRAGWWASAAGIAVEGLQVEIQANESRGACRINAGRAAYGFRLGRAGDVIQLSNDVTVLIGEESYTARRAELVFGAELGLRGNFRLKTVAKADNGAVNNVAALCRIIGS